MTYEGWSNYETWAVKLWMDNDEGSYHYWKDQAEAFRNDRSGLVVVLKDYHEETLPELDGFAGDLCTHALGMVDWYEIAYALLENLDDEEEEDEEE